MPNTLRERVEANQSLKGEETIYKPCDKCGQVQCMCDIDREHLDNGSGRKGEE